MTELLILEVFSSFSLASEKAKLLALQFKKSITIQRNDAGWSVLVPQEIYKELECKEIDNLEDYEPEENYSGRDDYEKEVLEQIIEEIQSDQDAWARSDEDGWFYED